MSATPLKRRRGRPRLTIEEMQQIAHERDGECLSEEYIDSGTHLRWRCKKGHEWEATPSNIKAGRWCSRCGKSAPKNHYQLTLEVMQQIARDRGGECLDTEYIDSKTHMRWRCEKGHEWMAIPNSVKNHETWCRQCARSAPRAPRTMEQTQKHYRLTIEDMQKLARKRGGECLSAEYEGRDTKLQWRCALGHEWETTPHNVRYMGTWCPNCRFKAESRCRSIFEHLLGKRFSKSRPQWLQGLELDGYCQELSLAFEYQGRQHSEIVPIWHPNGTQDLEQQKQRDANKLLLCDDNWVTVIEVRHDCPDYETFIRGELAVLGYLSE